MQLHINVVSSGLWELKERKSILTQISFFSSGGGQNDKCLVKSVLTVIQYIYKREIINQSIAYNHMNNHGVHKSTSLFFSQGHILVDIVKIFSFQLKIKRNFFWETKKDLSSNALFKEAEVVSAQLTFVICLEQNQPPGYQLICIQFFQYVKHVFSQRELDGRKVVLEQNL